MTQFLLIFSGVFSFRFSIVNEIPAHDIGMVQDAQNPVQFHPANGFELIFRQIQSGAVRLVPIIDGEFVIELFQCLRMPVHLDHHHVTGVEIEAAVGILNMTGSYAEITCHGMFPPFSVLLRRFHTGQ